ncbi:MAG: histidine kinase, partial [Bacteroidota bacterium]
SGDGFKGVEVYQNASYLDSSGTLWFGTVNGVIQYRPEADTESTVSPKIQLTGIKLFFDDLEKTPFADSTSSNFPIPEALTLPYDQHTISFAFNGTYLRNPEAIRYRWKLDGYNDEWSPPLKTREATFSNLDPGSYQFSVMAGDQSGNWIAQTASLKFTINRPPWEQWWVMPSAILAFLIIASLIIYSRFRRIKIRNEIEKERILMEKNIIELEQEASRLQMNPHFIFNSLNSIQGFISTNDRQQAKRYLVKFAKLMRLILENAREEFIPLENEINILDNYLELEKLSSNHQFEFSIDIGEQLESESTEIPPMMIQPFVENAILHGVRRKETMGHINLSFYTEGQLLICEITDNGIGRKASSQLNKQSRKNHRSTGILVTTKRLEQHQLQTGLPLGVQIIDMEENGAALGTKVVIRMPYEG